MQPPKPFSTAPRSMLCADIPVSKDGFLLIDESLRITIYALGFSPSIGPFQSFKYPAHPKVLNMLSFLTSSLDIIYLSG